MYVMTHELRSPVQVTSSLLNVLSRGYSITRRLLATREIVRDAATLRPGDRVHVTFHRGEASCKVEDLSPHSDSEE
jgi:exonuclease VII large subunit